jgi:hypothetical protein
MKFRLKSQIIDPKIVKVIARQKRNKDLDMQILSKKHLKQLEKVTQEIGAHAVPERFVVRKLPKKIGKGVFLNPRAKKIKKGDLIAPYAGLVSIIPQSTFDDADYAFDPVLDLTLTREEQKLFDPKNKYHPKRLYAVKLDALKQGNFTRFVNHSYKPNVIAYLASTKENPYQIIYFAKKDILPGEQLLVSYEDGDDNYWKPLGITPFPMTARTFKINANLRII